MHVHHLPPTQAAAAATLGGDSASSSALPASRARALQFSSDDLQVPSTWHSISSARAANRGLGSWACCCTGSHAGWWLASLQLQQHVAAAEEVEVLAWPAVPHGRTVSLSIHLAVSTSSNQEATMALVQLHTHQMAPVTASGCTRDARQHSSISRCLLRTQLTATGPHMFPQNSSKHLIQVRCKLCSSHSSSLLTCWGRYCSCRGVRCSLQVVWHS